MVRSIGPLSVPQDFKNVDVAQYTNVMRCNYWDIRYTNLRVKYPNLCIYIYNLDRLTFMANLSIQTRFEDVFICYSEI